MQEERQSGNRRVSRQSFTVRNSFNRSVDRFSEKRSDRSLDKPPSLYQGLDVEDYSRRSHENYDQFMYPENSNQNYRRSSASRNENFENTQMLDEGQINRRSSSNRNIHECSCQRQCNEQHCACFFYPNQLCIIGLCCSNCITKKNEYLMMADSSSKTACFCKSSKCLKMYCLCFREGKKCNKNICKCQGCQNIVNTSVNPDDLKKHKQKIPKQKKSKNNNTTVSTINTNRQNNHNQSHNPAKKQVKTKAKIQGSNYDFVFCSCKKSQCLKKYCPCYSINKECNQCCICEDCQNNSDQDQSRSQKKRRIQRFGRRDSSGSKQSQKQKTPIAIHHQKKAITPQLFDNKISTQMQEEDIDQFFQQNQDYTKIEMNKNMQFEPVNFGFFPNSN